MPTHTIVNKLNQGVPSDMKVGGVSTPYSIDPLEVFTVSDDEIGDIMRHQIDRGILQIVSTVARQDAGDGFAAEFDLTVENSRKLVEVEIGEHFTVDKVMVRITAAETVSVDGKISVGTNSPDFDDIMSSRTLINLTSVDDLWVEYLSGKQEVISGPREIFARVGLPAVAGVLEATVWAMGTGEYM